MTFFEDRALPVEFLPGRRRRLRVGPASELPPGTVRGVGPWAVGNVGGRYFAVSRSCRHLLGDLAKGTLDKEGRLVCPVHGSRYDVASGRAVRGPGGIYGKIPGLEPSFIAYTRILPLFRGEVTEEDGILYVR